MHPARLLVCTALAALAGLRLAAADVSPATSTPAISPAPSPDAKPALAVARNGADVLLTWEIPASLDIKLVELLRHTRREQKGRSRVASVHARPGLYTDKVPDPAADYWYWLKITLASGQVVGVGPVQTPPAEVWHPAP